MLPESPKLLFWWSWNWKLLLDLNSRQSAALGELLNLWDLEFLTCLTPLNPVPIKSCPCTLCRLELPAWVSLIESNSICAALGIIYGLLISWINWMGAFGEAGEYSCGEGYFQHFLLLSVPSWWWFQWGHAWFLCRHRIQVAPTPKILAFSTGNGYFFLSWCLRWNPCTFSVGILRLCLHNGAELGFKCW